MIKLCGEDINCMELDGALRKLDSYTGFPAKTAYRISKVVNKIKNEMLATQQEYINLGKKHGVTDSDGMPKRNTAGEFVFKDDANKKDFFVEFKKLMTKEFELAVHKPKISELDGAGLSPQEIRSLVKIIDMEDRPLKVADVPNSLRTQ